MDSINILGRRKYFIRIGQGHYNIMKKTNKIYVFSLLALFFPVIAAAADDKAIPEVPLTQEDLSDGLAGAYLSSQFAKSSGDLDKAARYLQRVYKDHPYNADIANQLQQILLLNGQVKEAIAVAETMPPGDPGNTVAALLLALRSAKQGDMARASGILYDAFGESNGQLWLPLVSAWLEASQKRMAKPLTIDSLPVDVTRAPALIYYHLALINAYAGFIDAAAADFGKVIDDPANPPGHIMEVLLQFYHRHNRPTALLPLVAAYAAANPNAASVQKEAFVATPQDGIAEVLFTMGSVMQSAGVPHDAVIYLQLVRYLKPDFPLAALTLADVYSEIKQYEKANPIYKSLAEHAMYGEKAQLRLAVNYGHAGKTRDALALLDNISRKSPGDYEALAAKGDMLRARLEFGEAAEAYSQAIARIPEPASHHWPLFFARGSCEERLGRWAAAERDLQRALALKPDQPDVLNYLGYGWLMRGERIDEARSMIERAIRMRPNDPQIVDSMGWALFALGKYGEAAGYLEKALELLPGDPTINDHLGDAYWHLDRKVEARYQWERALTYAPEANDAEAIRKKLKDGLAAYPAKPAVPLVADGARKEISVP